MERNLNYITNLIYIIAVIQIIIRVFNLNIIPNFLTDSLNLFESVEKYASYADNSIDYSIKHYVYMIFTCCLFYLARIYKNKLNKHNFW